MVDPASSVTALHARPEDTSSAARPVFVEHRSEEVGEILSAPPTVITRAGLIGLGVVALLLVGLALAVQLPSNVRARVALVTRNAPVGLVARSEGKIAALAVEEGSPVSEQQIVAIIDGQADYHQMFALQDWFARFKAAFLRDHTVLASPQLDIGRLGPAGAALLDLEGAASMFRLANRREQAFGIAGDLGTASGRQQRLHDTYAQEREIARAAADRARAAVQARRSLVAKGYVTRRDLEEAESRLDEAELAIGKLDIAAAENELNAGSFALRAKEARGQGIDRAIASADRVFDAIRTLQERIAEWDGAHVVRSPISGRARLFASWSDRSYVRAGERVVTIEPVSGAIEGVAMVPMRGFGKVRRGQRVVIDLEGYPREEFGQLIGTVRSFSAIAENDRYRVQIELPRELRTTHGTRIQFTQNMAGQATIKTSPTRIVERIKAWLWDFLGQNQ